MTQQPSTAQLAALRYLASDRVARLSDGFVYATNHAGTKLPTLRVLVRLGLLEARHESSYGMDVRLTRAGLAVLGAQDVAARERAERLDGLAQVFAAIAALPNEAPAPAPEPTLLERADAAVAYAANLLSLSRIDPAALPVVTDGYTARGAIVALRALGLAALDRGDGHTAGACAEAVGYCRQAADDEGSDEYYSAGVVRPAAPVTGVGPTPHDRPRCQGDCGRETTARLDATTGECPSCYDARLADEELRGAGDGTDWLALGADPEWVEREAERRALDVAHMMAAHAAPVSARGAA